MPPPTPPEIAELEDRLTAAMAADDFEACARLRDELRDLREVLGHPPRPDSPDAPTSTNLRRQEPGKMGLGTDQPSHRPGGTWKPPQVGRGRGVRAVGSWRITVVSWAEAEAAATRAATARPLERAKQADRDGFMGGAPRDEFRCAWLPKGTGAGAKGCNRTRRVRRQTRSSSTMGEPLNSVRANSR